MEMTLSKVLKHINNLYSQVNVLPYNNTYSINLKSLQKEFAIQK